MIVEIRVKNYRSYKDEASLTFEALDESFNSNSVTTVELEDGSTIRLLNSAVILGPNASGKSNMARAFQDLKFLTANSRNFDVKTGIPVYQPFLLDAESRASQTDITLKFVTEKRLYSYAISFNHQLFFSERLYEVAGGKDLLVYSRIFDAEKRNFNISVGEGWKSTTLDMSNMNPLPNQLILSELGTREANGLQYVYAELRDIQAQMVDSALDMQASNSYVAGSILKSEQSQLFQQLKKLLLMADQNILDVRMKEHADSEFMFPDSIPSDAKRAFIAENKWEFLFIHKGANESIAFPIGIESTGTKNLFSVATRVLNTLGAGGILVYDEMNVAMHPLLFRLLVQLFHSEKTNPRHAQLLFTTHDVSIIGDSLMRADQIWLAQKGDSGQSEIYSVQDFEDISIVLPFDEWYKSGRFGALPRFADVEKIFSYGTEDDNA